MNQSLDRAIKLLSTAGRLVVTTGAGMSKESEIPTFRDAPGALWANYDPQELATPEGFARNPTLVWKWYEERRRLMSQASPHEGHYAVAELETLYHDFVLLTQNIDNLHRAAGSKRIVELHGNIHRFKCFDNHHPVETLPETTEAPPRCECGSYVRPDVVWFGELLAPEDIGRAYAALAVCEVVLVVGTSGIVYPAAGFPALGKQAGASIIEVNPEETPISRESDVVVRGRAGDVLPRIVSGVRAARGS